MITRRDFIKTMSLLSGAVLAPVRWLGKWAGVEVAEAEEEAVGELYAGFVLLPEGAKVPEFVQRPNLSPPRMCGVGTDAVPTAISRFFDNEEALARETGLPIYQPKLLLDWLHLGSAFTVSHPTGEIFSACLSFNVYDLTYNRDKCVVSLQVQPDFAKPLPLLYVEPVNLLEKKSFLSQNGIRVPNSDEYVYYWIKDDIFYTLALDIDVLARLITNQQAKEIAKAADLFVNTLNIV